MKTFDVLEWIVAPLMANGVTESDYDLYGAGRALVFIRMAAYALDLTHTGQKVAEYHAYAGISAARTAIDATASWCNAALKLEVPPGNQVNLSWQDFRQKVLQAQPGVSKYVKNLGELGSKIDEHRQRAQHREGLAIISHQDSEGLGHPGGWYLMPKGLSGDRAADLRLSDLLNDWAEEIESNLQEIHKAVVQ